MASKTKQYSKEKLTGKVYTPFFVVEKILDDIGYKYGSISGRKILDPACGDGRFLVQIAKRIIKYIPKDKLQENLENIYGWDIDKMAIADAKKNLDKLTKPLKLNIKWNVTTQDALYKIQNDIFAIIGQQFDFIVGNPPYIRIQHLDEKNRNFIKQNYSFCRYGSTDIYIAFYQLAIKLLNKNGKCAFITPNSFCYTQTGKFLREYFVANKSIIQISNYKQMQLFENTSTYTAIVIFHKKRKKDFLYQEAQDINIFKTRKVNFNELSLDSFWQLSTKKIINKKGKKLKEIAKVHVGITTLADKVYMMKKIKSDRNYLYLLSKDKNIIQIEKDICKPIIKASKIKKDNDKITEYVIFPYKNSITGKRIYNEKELQNKYPLAYGYFLKNKELLLKRDNGRENKTAWYAFGRSQGLSTSFGKKILFSPMNKKPNFIYHGDPTACFYSGYCIKYDGDINFLLKKLNSDAMAEYINATAGDLRSGWKAYNKTIVQEFVIT
jgi:adenine-specific DNA-methyltransferase